MSSSSNHWKIQRVPAVLLAEEEEKSKKKNDYYPKVVSIGPYHHGKPELAVVEAFKPLAVNLFFRSPQEKNSFKHKVLDVIIQVRNCYEGESVTDYSDDYLAEMMLHDACLIITEMEIHLPHGDTYQKRKEMINHLGRLTGAVLFRDFILVENQIPLFVIEMMIKSRHGVDQEQKMINNYVNKCIFGEIRPILEYSRVPLHLLEFMHMVLVDDRVHLNLSRCCGLFSKESVGRMAPNDRVHLNLSRCCGLFSEKIVGKMVPNQPTLSLRSPKHATDQTSNWAKKVTHSFRTVMDLKARGIHFRPSATQSLWDVRFQSGFFHSKLQLPEVFLSHYSKPFFKNLVAYELLPGVETEPMVTSYIDLMQSLVERPEDLKELRERKILYNQLGSDEQALNVFKDINTHGATDDDLFFIVREQIQAHYNSRIKTWMADLIHTHFRSPWTGIAFLAATSIIALTAAQLYYAAHPPQNS